MTPQSALASIGRPALSALASLGRVALFAGQIISHLFRPPFYPREFLQSLLQIGAQAGARSAQMFIIG